ncbi:MAG: OsmC family protein [Cyclobacteriaceae bacterium]
MYANRKGLNVKEIKVHVTHSKRHWEDCEIDSPNSRIDHFVRILEVEGDLDEQQLAKLLEIADKCPVHRTLDVISKLKHATPNSYMRMKATLFGLFCLFVICASAQDEQKAETNSYHHWVFQKTSFVGGLGAVYSNEFQSRGIKSARFYYNANKRFCFGPEFSYLRNSDNSLWDVDFVAHYIFETKWIEIYPLVGVNYSKGKEKEQPAESGWGGL